jgi:integrase
MTVAEQSERSYVDERTKFEGVHRRHSLNCNKAIDRDRRCNCDPTYYGTVWDNKAGRNRRTERVSDPLVAKNLRGDLWAAVHSPGREGARGADHLHPDRAVAVSGQRRGRIRLKDAQPEFIKACKKGIVLNKHGRKYTKKAIKDLDSSLNRLPSWIRGRYLDDLTDPDFQQVVDDFKAETPPLSSSRINSVISSVRALSRWAQKRGKLGTKLAGDVQLPADDSTPRDRIAAPGEFAQLLDELEPVDALPWALAGYATARSQEIEHLDWPEVDFVADVLLLAEDDEAKKSEAARRIVPMVRQLRDRLYAEWLRQGRPKAGRVCPPRRADNRSGCISLNALQKRRFPVWEAIDLEPIGLQDSRHTAATWLDHSGVSPKIASVFMGHKAPKRQPDAAPITLGRYTHILPRELERARDQLQAFLDGREAEEEATDFTVKARESYFDAPTCKLAGRPA